LNDMNPPMPLACNEAKKSGGVFRGIFMMLHISHPPMCLDSKGENRCREVFHWVWEASGGAPTRRAGRGLGGLGGHLPGGGDSCRGRRKTGGGKLR